MENVNYLLKMKIRVYAERFVFFFYVTLNYMKGITCYIANTDM